MAKTMMNPQNIIIKKLHEDTGKCGECTLRGLWENGFANGQAFQEYNKHKLESKYMDESGFYVTTEFFDEVWKAFWSDLNGAEVIVSLVEA